MLPKGLCATSLTTLSALFPLMESRMRRIKFRQINSFLTGGRFDQGQDYRDALSLMLVLSFWFQLLGFIFTSGIILASSLTRFDFLTTCSWPSSFFLLTSLQTDHLHCDLSIVTMTSFTSLLFFLRYYWRTILLTCTIMVHPTFFYGRLWSFL